MFVNFANMFSWISERIENVHTRFVGALGDFAARTKSITREKLDHLNELYQKGDELIRNMFNRDVKHLATDQPPRLTVTIEGTEVPIQVEEKEKERPIEVIEDNETEWEDCPIVVDELDDVEESGSEEEVDDAEGVTGIRNIGNFCYGNSTIQTFFNHPAFGEYLSHDPVQKACETNEEFEERQEIFYLIKSWYETYETNNSEQNSEKAQLFHTYAEKMQDIARDPYGFQDAILIYQLILRTIGYDFTVNSKKIYKLAEDNNYSTVHCETHTVLSIPLSEEKVEEESDQYSSMNLQELIERKFAKTPCRDENNGLWIQLENGNAEYSSDWEEFQKISSAPPPMMVLQYLRYDNKGHKLHNNIQIPQDRKLDFSSAFGSPVKYEISSVNIHSGAHYYSYIQKNGRWHCCNDSRTWQVREEDVPFGEAYFVVLNRVD